MTSDLDIYRSAKQLVDQCGADAIREAAKRYDLFSNKGDDDGAAVWKRIKAAVEELLNNEPDGPTH